MSSIKSGNGIPSFYSLEHGVAEVNGVSGKELASST
jgi:hypothetical protein